MRDELSEKLVMQSALSELHDTIFHLRPKMGRSLTGANVLKIVGRVSIRNNAE